jgi:tRNA pseudouridine38-40 synthase
MQNYKMTIAYDGRKYTGFSKSKKNADKSVQGKLESILQKLYGQPIEVIAAVNTDAGVHAKEQVVHFIVPTDDQSPRDIQFYVDKYLPDDLIVLDVEKADDRFHSRYNVATITYEYRLWKRNAQHRPLFERQYVNFMSQVLDVEKMKKAAEDLLGEHDFLAFTSNKKTKKSIKKITQVEVKETANEIIITMTGTGFLLNMERIIVGTLIQVGLGQLTVNAVSKGIRTRDMDEVGHKASAGALSLLKVTYK